MSLGPFLRRELAISVRSGRASSDRRSALLLTSATFLGCMYFWDWSGWDRATLLGAHLFGLATFGLMVAGMFLLAYALVIQPVGPAIAAERDRKTLDALLSSRFSSFEIVAGVVASYWFRYVNALAATLPVVVLLVYLGGVAPAWAVLAMVGVSSTALFLASFSVAASVGASTASRAVVNASAMFAFWIGFPPLYLILRPILWPGPSGWTTEVLILLVESSPMGLLMNLLGVLPKPGGPFVAVGRMVGWQLVWTVVALAWSTVRLRPASRSLYDVEGERGRIKRLKAAIRRPPRRPPCSDAPVYWCEAYSSRYRGLFEAICTRVIQLGMIAAVVAGTWTFAVPAFAELAQRGYGPSPEAFSLPDIHPVVRHLIRIRVPSVSSHALPGQARLEFSIVLRLISAFCILWFATAAFSMAYESIKRERRRETWLGLLATPLSAREILRGKALGSLWNLRWGVAALVAPWTVGLLAGSVHPVGFVAALSFLAVMGAFYTALGLRMALREWDADRQAKANPRLIDLPITLVGSVLLTAGPVAVTWASLLTFEDIAAAIRAAPLPSLPNRDIAEWVWARGIVLWTLAGIAAMAFGAWWFDRSNDRIFDEAVGRPVRGKARELDCPGS